MENKGCIMVGVNHPDIENLRNIINENDVYNNEENEYGIETFPHVTILYGIIHDKHTINILKNLLPPLNDIKIIGVSISSFNNEEFDVLKIDIKSNILNNLNEMVKDSLEYESMYPEFNPHLTLAYLKKGTAFKYEKKMLDKILVLEPTEYVYSFDNERDYWK